MALHDERRKAKSYKEELEKYKAKYDQDENAPDPVEDPEGYKLHVREQARKELYEETVDNSRNLMMENHGDIAVVDASGWPAEAHYSGECPDSDDPSIIYPEEIYIMGRG